MEENLLSLDEVKSQFEHCAQHAQSSVKEFLGLWINDPNRYTPRRSCPNNL